MNSKELRLGNWVDYHFMSSSGRSKIEEIKEDVVTLCEIGKDYRVGYGYKNISPIQLTSDILERCGFEIREQEKDYIYYGFGANPEYLLAQFTNGLKQVRHRLVLIVDVGNQPNKEKYWTPNFKDTVHELQNWHKEYYNEELDINFKG